MVLRTNLKADDRRTRLTGQNALWATLSDPHSQSGLIADHWLGALVASAKLVKATTVNAGEGS